MTQHTDAHVRGVEQLVASGARRRGLARVLRLCCNLAMTPASRLIPDAFKVSKSKRAITLYEVIATHPLYPEKLARVRALRDQLAAVGWTLHLMACGATRSEMTLESPIEVDIDSPDYLNEIGNERIRRGACFLSSCEGGSCK